MIYLQLYVPNNSMAAPIQAKECLTRLSHTHLIQFTHHSEIVRNATEAEAKQKPVNGILARSPLTSMINLVDSVPVDYMHAVLEGWLTKSWFNSANHKYLGRKSAEIDSELLKQTPPHEFSRPPRSTPCILESIRTTHLAFILLCYLPSLFWRVCNSYHVGS